MDFAGNITRAAAYRVPSVVNGLSAGDLVVSFIFFCWVVLKATDGKLHHVPNPKFHLWYSYPQEGESKTPTIQKRTRNINVKMTESVVSCCVT